MRWLRKKQYPEAPGPGTSRTPYRQARPKRPTLAPHQAKRNAKPIWKRPVAWLVTLTVAAVGTFYSDTVRDVAEAWLSPGDIADAASGPPIRVVDVGHSTEVGNDIVLPGGDSPGVRQFLTSHNGGSPPPDDWLDKHNAVDVGEAIWSITLETKRRDGVVIEDMLPVIAGGRCGPSRTGSLIENPSAGMSGKILLELVPDTPRPLFQRFDDKGQIVPFFIGSDAKKIVLRRDVPDIVQLRASIGSVVPGGVPTGPDCRWTIRVTYIAGDTRRQMTITAPRGKPFELTGLSKDRSAYSAVYLSSLGCPYNVRKRVSPSEWVAIQKARKLCL